MLHPLCLTNTRKIYLSLSLQLYAWPLLQTLFSEVLTRDDWLKLWDHILSHHPSFLLVSVAAYLSTARQALLHCSSLEDVEVCLTLYREY